MSEYVGRTVAKTFPVSAACLAGLLNLTQGSTLRRQSRAGPISHQACAVLRPPPPPYTMATGVRTAHVPLLPAGARCRATGRRSSRAVSQVSSMLMAYRCLRSSEFAQAAEHCCAPLSTAVPTPANHCQVWAPLLPCSYEDGDQEELELFELKRVLMPESKAGAKRKAAEPDTAVEEPAAAVHEEAGRSGGSAGTSKDKAKAAAARSLQTELPANSVDEAQLRGVVEEVAARSTAMVRCARLVPSPPGWSRLSAAHARPPM